MNLVEVCTGYPPDRTGGAEQVVSCIREGLVPEGHRVRVVTRCWGTEISSPDIIQIRTPKSELSGYMSWALQASRRVSRINPDLIHCHGLEGAIVCILTKSRPFSRVVHVHNSLSRESGYRSSVVHWFGLWALELGIALADVVVVPTEVVKEDIKRHIHCINRSKIVVVPNPVAQSKPTSPEDLAKLRGQLSLGRRKVILYFGKVKRTKGLEDICKAYEIMRQKKDVALVISGAPTATDRFLEKLKATYGDVVFTGFVPNSAPFYQIADLFCIYTTGFEGGETFAIALAEAMFHRVPIVCADNPIFREVTGENAVFVEPRNVIALARAFDEAVANPLSLRPMVENGYEIAAKRYTPSLFLERIKTVYRAAVARK